MSFKDVYISYSYDSTENDILEEFYIPVLTESTRYDRIAGFFNSSSLHLCSSGIKNLIKNKGKMRLITSPLLTEQDILTISKLENGKVNDYLGEILIKQVQCIDEVFERGYWALAWMLANGYLEIKIAIVLDENGKLANYDYVEKSGIFHQKIGILYDNENNCVAFSGSVNETSAAWTKNIEEFSVFRSWEESEYKYAIKHMDRFERIWSGKNKRTWILDLPEAVKNSWIRTATQHNDDPELVFEKKSRNEKIENAELKLFEIQEAARDAWLSAGRVGIIEMATGTGKTITAIACIEELVKADNERLLVIIASPQNTISKQWVKETKWIKAYFDGTFEIDGTSNKWRATLESCLLDIKLGISKRCLIITSHSLLCSNDFILQIEKTNGEYKILLVGDEVHALGAKQRRRGLIDLYQWRLGLSATPDRLFDEEGTNIIRDYFGPTVYSFDIGQAQNTINPMTGYPYLTDYYYYPVFVNLEKDELEEYYKESLKLLRFPKESDDIDQKMFELILFKRANIIKKARQKICALSDLINKYYNERIEQAIIFTSPEQKDEVLQLLRNKGISASKYTEEEEERPSEEFGGQSERQYLISKLETGIIQALVAIKCLDEGIDIPSARAAILMASSKNPREYIQRIGRVIRRHEGKNVANIFDMIVTPVDDIKYQEIHEIEKTIFKKEKERAMYLIKFAKNGSEALLKLSRR